jgi:hypothetical protein
MRIAMLTLVPLAAWCTNGAFGIAADYSIKSENAPIPKEITESIAKLLSDRSVQLLDSKGDVVAEVWFRKELPTKATAEQVKNGITYRELEESTVLGAVRFVHLGSEYRQQKIKEGVYTLRLGFQPMDGDHMGTAPHSEFALLVPAAADTKPDTMSAKELQDLSKKASGSSHPAVMLLYPNEKPEDQPKLVDKGNGTWVLNTKSPATAGEQKAVIGIGLTLVGHASE